MPTKPKTHDPSLARATEPSLFVWLRDCALKGPSQPEAVVDYRARNLAVWWKRPFGSMSNRCCENRNTLHTAVESRLGRPVVDAKNMTPFNEGFSLSINLNHAVASAVSRLLGFCRPAAILLAVVAIVVDAVDGVFRGRPSPHVCKESLEVIDPFVAYNDPPAAVVWKGWAALTVASVFHPMPDSVFRTRTAFITSTGLNSVQKPLAGGFDFIPATASAEPEVAGFCCAKMSENEQFSERPSGVVFEQWAGWNRLEFNHDMHSLQRVVWWPEPCWRLKRHAARFILRNQSSLEA